MQDRDNRILRDDDDRSRDTACGAATTSPAGWSHCAPTCPLLVPASWARSGGADSFAVGTMMPRAIAGWRMTAVAVAAAISIGVTAVGARHWFPGAGVE